MDFVRELISIAFHLFDEANGGSVKVVEVGLRSDALVQVLAVEGAVAQGLGDREDTGLDPQVGPEVNNLRPSSR